MVIPIQCRARPLILRNRDLRDLKTLFVNRSAGQGFDGGRRSRYQAEARDQIVCIHVAGATRAIIEGAAWWMRRRTICRRGCLQIARDYDAESSTRARRRCAGDARLARRLKSRNRDVQIGSSATGPVLRRTIARAKAIDWVGARIDYTCRDVAAGLPLPDKSPAFHFAAMGNTPQPRRALIQDFDELPSVMDVYDATSRSRLLHRLPQTPYVSHYTGAAPCQCSFCLMRRRWRQQIPRAVHAKMLRVDDPRDGRPTGEEFFFETTHLPRTSPPRKSRNTSEARIT